MHSKVVQFKQMPHSIGIHKKFAKKHGYLFIITYDYIHL
jgi:hypothetical protein